MSEERLQNMKTIQDTYGLELDELAKVYKALGPAAETPERDNPGNHPNRAEKPWNDLASSE